MADEPNATGSRDYTNDVAAVANLKFPGVETASTSVATLDTALKGLVETLNKYNQSASMSNGVNRLFDTMTTKAKDAAAAVSGVQRALGGVTTGTTSTSGSIGSGGNTGANWVANTIGKGAGAVARAGGYEGAGSWVSGASGAANLLLAPLKFLQDRISTNRETALAGSGALSMAARQQGTDVGSMMGTMARFPGQVFGNPGELMNLFEMLPRLGGSFNFGGRAGGQGGRAAGLLEGIRQAQSLAPGQSVEQITSNIGGFAANSGAQRQAAYLTGGAFAMIGGGGRQKTLSEWAESVWKWLINLRGGDKKGKDFNYGELMAQYFPGSNIDAWFDVNGVNQGMKDYWWTYALQKARTSTSGEMTIGPEQTNLAYRRLRSQSELTRTEFGMAGGMMGQYANREVSNQWFNRQVGNLQQSVIPALGNSGIGRLISMLPDTLEQMLMGLISGGGAESFFGGVFGGGDADLSSGIGDTFGEFGSNGLSGMHPDMKSKVGKMMRANPRLSVTSGFRDTGVQQRLKGKGYSRVSGKPSAHTRGLAADLGPPSEYGWIVKNAGKFGLKSGNGQGEPWHVGIGDWTDDPLGSLSGWLDNVNPFDMISKMLSWITGKATGLLGGGAASTTGQGQAALDPDFLAQFPEGTLTGLPVELAALAKGARPVGTGNKRPGNTTGGAGGTTGSTTLSRAIIAAKAAAAAGFTGDDLFKAVSISGRESGGWNPMAYNGNTGTGDKSYGLMQINMLGSLGASRRKAYGLSADEDLWDPYTNMRVAHAMEAGRPTPFYDWGPYKHMDALHGTEKYQDTARQAISQAGVGDVDAMMMQSMLPSSSSSSGGVNFHNSFVINGGGSGAGGGGVDIRRTVSMIADQLEDEMKRRLARTN